MDRLVINGVELASDGVTVWAFTEGQTIGRFGRFGIDVHVVDQTAGVSCLYCTHEPVTSLDWDVFKEKMAQHHGVAVPDTLKPLRLRPR